MPVSAIMSVTNLYVINQITNRFLLILSWNGIIIHKLFSIHINDHNLCVPVSAYLLYFSNGFTKNSKYYLYDIFCKMFVT